MTTLEQVTPHDALEEPSPRKTPRWVRWAAHVTWSRAAVAAVVLVVVAVVLQRPGFYVYDSRFEHYWAGDLFLSRHRHLWDGVRGLGRPTPYYAPVQALVFAVVDLLGSPAWLTQRLQHAVYFVLAGSGMVALVRVFRPTARGQQAVAAAIYVLSPYSMQFLIPSGLFLHYALAPWFVVATVRGVRGEDRWRWAAVFALGVFVVGSLNIPSLFYALFPVPVALLYVLAVDRSARVADAARWLGAAVALTGLVSVATLVHLTGTASVNTENLLTTELASTVHRTSSWTESWRGLGFWLTYFRQGGTGLARPEASPYFGVVWIIVGTFVLPVLALVSLAVARGRARLLFGGLLAVGLALMVGIYPAAEPPPIGAFLAELYESWVPARGFRSGYKGGAAAVMGVSGLVALGTGLVATGLTDRDGRRRWLARSVAALAAVGLAVSSFPLWTGDLYAAADGFDELPDYWVDAMSHLNEMEGDGRVMILPGYGRNRYRWGFVGDDIFDGLLRRPHVERGSFGQEVGTNESGDLLAALDSRAVEDAYRPGEFAPIARRLGIRWVVVRNDIDWQASRAARPSALDAWRADPDMQLVASFGEPGENVSRPADRTASILGENELPPVQVYEVRDPWRSPYAVPDAPPMLLSGSGQAWPRLARDGTLADAGPVRYTASAAPDELTDALERGSEVVVTDANRRRVVQVTAPRNFESHTIAAGEELNRPPLDLFTVPGSQSVANYGDAVTVRSSTESSLLNSGFRPWFRPSNAFDGLASTAWVVPAFADVDEQWLRAELRDPAELDDMTFVDAAGTPRRISRATVLLSDGTRVPVEMDDDGETTVSLPDVTTTSVEVIVDEISGLGAGQAGFAEIRLGDLDLAERIQVPDDVFADAGADGPLVGLLEEAPFRYSFERSIRDGPQDVEVALHRRFRTVGSRSFEVTGSFRIGRETSDYALAGLLESPVTAVATDRRRGLIDVRGDKAIDGDEGTAWEALPRKGESVTVGFEERQVAGVRVVLAESAAGGRTTTSRVMELTVRAGADGELEQRVEVPGNLPCRELTDDAGQRWCLKDVEVPLDVATSSVQVELSAVEQRSGPVGQLPVRVAEVVIDGVDAGAGPVLAEECVPLLEVDGRPVPVRLDGDAADVLSGDEVDFTSCGPVDLDAGWHELISTPLGTGSLVGVDLRTGGAPTGGQAPELGGRLTEPTRVRVEVDAADGGYVVIGQSYAPGWHARLDGEDLGPAQRVDTLAGWRLPPGASGTLDATYRPQRVWELALAFSAGMAGLCVWLVATARRRRRS